MRSLSTSTLCLALAVMGLILPSISAVPSISLIQRRLQQEEEETEGSSEGDASEVSGVLPPPDSEQAEEPSSEDAEDPCSPDPCGEFSTCEYDESTMERSCVCWDGYVQLGGPMDDCTKEETSSTEEESSSAEESSAAEVTAAPEGFGLPPRRRRRPINRDTGEVVYPSNGYGYDTAPNTNPYPSYSQDRSAWTGGHQTVGGGDLTADEPYSGAPSYASPSYGGPSAAGDYGGGFGADGFAPPFPSPPGMGDGGPAGFFCSLLWFLPGC
ncbi:unnamed protein product [Vitrella brassicaformis CCMP3155]|uniref:EGF-like domain-containing protein n=1 Tax=Vitrella brassicaformis (strain CCMP3155) TaxID=1169540 RepID=A0A0G4FCC4_VITBC|nr:unnamed protein product [Vitrella brassicaformis CCMP3155]|eukprot:CEM10856.1 unnamed protein product [Vitrella brassicaformis CCMP3155]